MTSANRNNDVPVETSHNPLRLLPPFIEEEILEARHKIAIQNYETKNPMDSIIHEVFVDHFEEFVAALKEKEKHLPLHVIREMDAFMNCGIPEAGGYSKWACKNCKGSPKIIAFSCKCRGFCPRCGGRRMSQSAANAVDFIFPNQTARQWVISLPFHLRYWVAADANLMDKILAIVNLEIGNLYKSKAAAEHGVTSGQTGSISYIQSAGGQINRNPHLHLLHLEGVFDDGVENIEHILAATKVNCINHSLNQSDSFAFES